MKDQLITSQQITIVINFHRKYTHTNVNGSSSSVEIIQTDEE